MACVEAFKAEFTRRKVFFQDAKQRELSAPRVSINLDILFITITILLLNMCKSFLEVVTTNKIFNVRK